MAHRAQTNLSLQDFLAILLIGFLWGLNWTAIKVLLTEIGPLTLRAVSFSFATLLLAAIGLSLRQPLRISKSEFFPMAIVGFFLIFCFNILATLGQVLVEVSKAAIIVYIMPSLTAVLAAVFLGEQISARLILALMAAMVGLGILASEDFILLIENPMGPALMVMAALSWAIGNVTLKARTWRLPSLSLTMWFFLLSSLICWPLVFAFENPWRQEWPSLLVLSTLGFHVLGPTVIGYVLWTRLVERLPATVAAISILTAPIIGVLSAALLLGDPVTWQRGVALAAIVLSIAMALMLSRHPFQTS